jgi:hypothetical protein
MKGDGIGMVLEGWLEAWVINFLANIYVESLLLEVFHVEDGMEILLKIVKSST